VVTVAASYRPRHGLQHCWCARGTRRPVDLVRGGLGRRPVEGSGAGGEHFGRDAEVLGDADSEAVRGARVSDHGDSGVHLALLLCVWRARVFRVW
jgi:hypothetical protein